MKIPRASTEVQRIADQTGYEDAKSFLEQSGKGSAPGTEQGGRSEHFLDGAAVQGRSWREEMSRYDHWNAPRKG